MANQWPAQEAVDVYRAVARRAGVPGNIQEMSSHAIRKSLRTAFNKLSSFRRMQAPGNLAKQATDVALSLQGPIADLLGRHPPLALPGKHGTRKALLGEALDAVFTMNSDLRSFYAVLRSSEEHLHH